MTTHRTAYEQPAKCKTKEDVRARLAECLHFGSEYETVTGYKFGEHGNLEALKRFLPDEMAREVEREFHWHNRRFFRLPKMGEGSSY